MKKNILLFLIFSSSFSAFAQFALDYEPIYEKQTWSTFKNGKLYVSMMKNKGESEYDKALMDAVKKYWTFNQFEFITDAEKSKELHKTGENVFLYSYVLYKNIYVYITNKYSGTKSTGMAGKYPARRSLSINKITEL